MNDKEEKKLLLLVDDNASHLHVVRSILREDCTIRIATSGAQAGGSGESRTLARPHTTGLHDAGCEWLRGVRRLKSHPGNAGYPGDFPYSKLNWEVAMRRAGSKWER